MSTVCGKSIQWYILALLSVGGGCQARGGLHKQHRFIECPSRHVQRHFRHRQEGPCELSWSIHWLITQALHKEKTVFFNSQQCLQEFLLEKSKQSSWGDYKSCPETPIWMMAWKLQFLLLYIWVAMQQIFLTDWFRYVVETLFTKSQNEAYIFSVHSHWDCRNLQHSKSFR